MKKHILLAVTLFSGTVIFAQTKPSFGIKAGVSVAGMRGEAVGSLNNLIDYTNGRITTEDRTGFYAGATATVPLGGAFSVESGLQYTQRGYALNGELGIKGAEFIGARANARLTQHYIDLPLVLKANIDGFQVFAGPQVSYLAKSDLRTQAGLLGFNLLNKTFDATEQFNRWDAGLTGGVGYQFRNGVNISAAYDHGLVRTDANQNLNAYNRGFRVGLGVNF